MAETLSKLNLNKQIQDNANPYFSLNILLPAVLGVEEPKFQLLHPHHYYHLLPLVMHLPQLDCRLGKGPDKCFVKAVF